MKRLIRIATVMAVLAIGAAWTPSVSAHPPEPGPRHHHHAPAVRLPPLVWHHTPYGQVWGSHDYYRAYIWGYQGHRPGLHIDLYLDPLGGVRYGRGCHW
jgi:hypothetical protein